MSRRKQFKPSTAAAVRLKREQPGRWSWWFRGYRGQSYCAWYIARLPSGVYRVEARDLANGWAHRDTLAEVRELIASQYTYI